MEHTMTKEFIFMVISGILVGIGSYGLIMLGQYLAEKLM